MKRENFKKDSRFLLNPYNAMVLTILAQYRHFRLVIGNTITQVKMKKVFWKILPFRLITGLYRKNQNLSKLFGKDERKDFKDDFHGPI